MAVAFGRKSRIAQRCKSALFLVRIRLSSSLYTRPRGTRRVNSNGPSRPFSRKCRPVINFLIKKGETYLRAERKREKTAQTPTSLAGLRITATSRINQETLRGEIRTLFFQIVPNCPNSQPRYWNSNAKIPYSHSPDRCPFPTSTSAV